MKTIMRLAVGGILAGTVVFGGCSTTNEMLGRNQQTWTMQTKGSDTKVEGKIQVGTGEEGNRDLKIAVTNLPAPDSEFAGASTYVVWLKPHEGHAVNIGVLSPDKNLKAELKTKTPFTTFDIMVTAEDTPQPTAPSGHEVMTAKVHVAT